MAHQSFWDIYCQILFIYIYKERERDGERGLWFLLAPLLKTFTLSDEYQMHETQDRRLYHVI